MLSKRYLEKYNIKNDDEIEIDFVPYVTLNIGIYKIEYLYTDPSIAYINSSAERLIQSKLNIEIKAGKSNFFEIITNDGSNAIINIKLDSNNRNEVELRLTHYLRVILGLDNKNKTKVKIFSMFENHKLNFLLRNLFLKAILGEKKTYLKTIHPLNYDEGYDIVRIPTEILKLIGVEEGEYIIISYGINNISVQALSLKNLNNMLTRECSYCIGIPANIRTRLGLRDVGYYDVEKDITVSGTIVAIKRDNWFILKKNINKSALPIIGVVLTIFIVFPETYLRIIIGTISVIFFFLVSLSEKRIH